MSGEWDEIKLLEEIYKKSLIKSIGRRRKSILVMKSPKEDKMKDLGG